MNVVVRRSLQPLRVRYAAPLRRKVEAFWSWWTGQLFALLPEYVRDTIAQRRQKLFIEPHGESLRMSLGTYANNREVLRLPLETSGAAGEQLPRDAQQTILLVPDDKVLVKSLVLPLAAEENLREVIAFEMDQHTPFPASRVYFDFVVTARDSDRQQLSVDLVYSPRSAVEALLESLAKHNLKVDVVTSHSGDRSNLRTLNLLPSERRRSRRIALRQLNVALAALLAVQLLAAIALPIMQKNQAIEIVESQVQEAATAAREGNQLRRNLENMADASRFLVEKKQSEYYAVQLIDEISRILPDHTWIVRLDLSETELQLQGQSKASSSLIAIIESSPLFENARFRSPVVQVSGTDADRFHLSADLERSNPR